MTGVVYVVGTPIGNLDDLSKRAVDTLRSVDACMAEDTRRTGRLLAHLGLDVPLVSLHEHNEVARTEQWLDRIKAGASVALVSDAGTPTISDPGRRLLSALRAEGVRVVPIPGASAVPTALSAAGVPADRFTFMGFVPRKAGERATWIEDVRESAHTTVAFEAPGRLSGTLSELAAAGLAERHAVVCREMTKLHEEFVDGTVETLATLYADRTVKGEVTLVISGRGDAQAPDLASVTEEARNLAREGLRGRELADRLVESHGLSRNEAYRVSLSVGDTDA